MESDSEVSKPLVLFYSFINPHLLATEPEFLLSRKKPIIGLFHPLPAVIYTSESRLKTLKAVQIKQQ